jgi:hypothetical protein
MVSDSRRLLRNIIGVASHLDGLLCEHGKSLPLDAGALLRADLERIDKELGFLADDVEFLVPNPSRKRQAQ